MAAIRTPPPEDNYDPAATTASNSGSRFGMYILKDGVKGVIKTPSWNGTLTVFRPFPYLDAQDPNTKFAPYRLDPGGRNAFGPWIRKYDCAWKVGVGANRITFLLCNPGAKEVGYDPYNTPLGVLYRAIENACKKGHAKTVEWQPLREGGMGKGKALTAPTECYLMQGVILIIDDKPQYGEKKVPIGWAKDRETCFMAYSKGLGEKLIAELNKPVEGFKGDPGDFEGRYLNGDPVNPLGGRYIFTFQKGHDPRNKFNSQPTQAQSWSEGSDEVGSETRGGGDQDKGYDLFLDKICNGMSADLAAPTKQDKIREKVIYWPDALWFPTPHEQAKLLWGVFPKSACMYAWEGFNKAWISDEMRAEYLGAMSVSVPGTVPGGAPTSAKPPTGDEWNTPAADADAPWVSGAAAPSPFGHDGGSVPDATIPPPVPEPTASASPAAHPHHHHTPPAPVTPPATSNVTGAVSTSPDPFAAANVPGGFDAPPAAAGDPNSPAAIAKLAAARNRAKGTANG